MRIPSLALGLASLTLAAQRPMQIEDLFKVQRVAAPALSAKGDLAYQVGVADPEANRITTRLWFKPAGGEARSLDLGPGNQAGPRFSPDGTRLAYEAGGQVWVLDLATGQHRQLTRLSGGASGPLWSPDGTRIAFTSATVPSGSEAENAAYLKAQAARKATGRVYDTLMYRHWMEWRDPRQVSHLFVVKADGSEAPKDLTAGLRADVPMPAMVSTGNGYAWRPDGRFLAFNSQPDFAVATSTNGDIFEVSVEGGPLRKLSDNPAMDADPAYAPDGRTLAWRAQREPGFESDKWELWVYDRAAGKVVATTRAFDRQVGAFAWAGKDLVFTAEDRARNPLWRWDGRNAPKALTPGLHVDAFTLSPDGRKALLQVSSLAAPPDLYALDLGGGKPVRVTRHNEALERELGSPQAEDLWTAGAPGPDGKAPQVHALVLKPANFDPTRRYPVAFILHGGPQGSNADHWHYRWNAQAWAGRGYLVVEPNPRGSTGFGQQFTNEISGDWGGRAIQDMLCVLDAALKRYPNADRDRVIAAGGSYGGYAVNWLAGHHADRFAAFVSHAGIFNALSMQLASEELWFPKHEFKGFPWESPETKALWERNSPHNAAGAFSKPMLVVHGELDYRVAYTEALQLYNIHQLRGIPSQLLVFPDEGHFVARPANAKLWHETVFAWIDRWTKR